MYNHNTFFLNIYMHLFVFISYTQCTLIYYVNTFLDVINRLTALIKIKSVLFNELELKLTNSCIL